jgi:hypothetical protein
MLPKSFTFARIQACQCGSAATVHGSRKVSPVPDIVKIITYFKYLWKTRRVLLQLLMSRKISPLRFQRIFSLSISLNLILPKSLTIADLAGEKTDSPLKRGAGFQPAIAKRIPNRLTLSDFRPPIGSR